MLPPDSKITTKCSRINFKISPEIYGDTATSKRNKIEDSGMPWYINAFEEFILFFIQREYISGNVGFGRKLL